MKKIIIICAALLMNASVFAQSPDKMSYQAVIRNSSNALVSNQVVGMRISILQGSSSGTAVYVETQTPTTNANGLVSIEIGGGTVITGNFSTIDWANGPYFVKTETDPTGGTNYSIIGTSQLLSVPYALHAKTAESIAGTTVLSIGDSYQGGIIFWLDSTGQHGLIASTEDQAISMEWYNGVYKFTGASGDGLYAGSMNTALIVASQIADAPTANFAAKVCADYSVTVNGITYGDWYLPSFYELGLLYAQKNVVGGFTNNFYWSSTENNSMMNQAHTIRFSDGFPYGYGGKESTYSVRAIRAF